MHFSRRVLSAGFTSWIMLFGGYAHADSPDYLSLVVQYADCMLEHGRDRYGEVHSPLFACT
jgi:hypothetical protein